MLAVLDGRPVTIVTSGDLPGHSEVCQYVDGQGRLNWEKQELFTIIDPRFLPPSQDTLREISQSLRR